MSPMYLAMGCPQDRQNLGIRDASNSSPQLGHLLDLALSERGMKWYMLVLPLSVPLNDTSSPARTSIRMMIITTVCRG